MKAPWIFSLFQAAVSSPAKSASASMISGSGLLTGLDAPGRGGQRGEVKSLSQPRGDATSSTLNGLVTSAVAGAERPGSRALAQCADGYVRFSVTVGAVSGLTCRGEGGCASMFNERGFRQIIIVHV